MPILNSIGGRLDIVVRQGAQSSVINAVAKDGSGNPLVLTGVTVVGSIYDARANSAGALSVDTSQLASGIVRAWVADTTSAALAALPLSAPANYSYAINLSFSDGSVHAFLYGTLRVIVGAGQ